jgi:hypothetical protein
MRLWLVALLVAASVPAMAAERPADPLSPIGKAGALLIETLTGRAAGGSLGPAAGAAGGVDSGDATAAAAGVERVGRVILEAAGGRSLQQALAAGGAPENPFGLAADPLLAAAGVRAISADATGKPIAEGELSIYPDYVTPGARFTPSAAMPPILPFAFERGGTCYGGYVTGFPAPATVEAVDMTGRACNARSVDNVVAARYRRMAAGEPVASPAAETGSAGGDAGTAGPAAGGAGSGPVAATRPPPDNSLFDGTSATDLDLEMIVYGAYSAAYNRAVEHQNFFTDADFGFAALRRAIRDALEKEGYGATSVPELPAADAAAAKACADNGRIELRAAVTRGGTGIVLAAVSDRRLSAYEYDPEQPGKLVITHAADCLDGAELGPAPEAPRDRLSTPPH